jgi:hypothetical protein
VLDAVQVHELSDQFEFVLVLRHHLLLHFPADS